MTILSWKPTAGKLPSPLLGTERGKVVRISEKETILFICSVVYRYSVHCNPTLLSKLDN